MIFRVIKNGNSLAFIVPKEAVVRLRVQPGDVVHVTETPEGYHVTPFDPTFGQDYELSEEAMWRDRDLLHQLVKM